MNYEDEMDVNCDRQREIERRLQSSNLIRSYMIDAEKVIAAWRSLFIDLGNEEQNQTLGFAKETLEREFYRIGKAMMEESKADGAA